MHIGDQLLKMRKKKGMRQYDLARAAGVPRNTIIRIEKGRVDPRISTLVRLAKALKIDVAELVRKT